MLGVAWLCALVLLGDDVDVETAEVRFGVGEVRVERDLGGTG